MHDVPKMHDNLSPPHQPIPDASGPMRGHGVDTTDLAIIGAGPAGLCLARAAADSGLSVTLIERQPRSVLAEPASDGRDIALTHRAESILRRLGVWERSPSAEIAPLREARVSNGGSRFAMRFDAAASGREQLGFLVSNHVIRRAAFQAAIDGGGVSLLDAAEVVTLSTTGEDGQVGLADGRSVRARLVIAADSRLSENRRRMGIGAQMHDFGRVVIVCRLGHTRPNHGIAHECFRYGDTLAVLPMNGEQVSAVITVTADRAPAILAMPADAFAALVRARFDDRLGEMRLTGERHAYPLVGVYAHRFVARRFALIGDAAVGMHPVTAHGFNFGLYGIDTLMKAFRFARHRGNDIGAEAVLSAYQREHRLATLPIYLGTNALVQLFTDDRAPARIARSALLRVADRLGPLKHTITRQLTGAAVR